MEQPGDDERLTSRHGSSDIRTASVQHSTIDVLLGFYQTHRTLERTDWPDDERSSVAEFDPELVG